MKFWADYKEDPVEFNYIEGDYHSGLSIATTRYFHLFKLDDLSKHTLLISMKDQDGDGHTKWKKFSSGTGDKEGFAFQHIRMAYEIHRSMLDNEIVVESDLQCEPCIAAKKQKVKSTVACEDCYRLNWDATRIFGAIAESKGFIPHYYYSGNKSIHTHIYFDWHCLLEVDMFFQKQMVEKFKTGSAFKKKFIEWLRAKMISCWDTQARVFDEDLIRSTHLIRAELSRHKAGYKTFEGYHYKDISYYPRVCNSKNLIYPVLGKIILSRPISPQTLLEEFIEDMEKEDKAILIKKRDAGLNRWLNPQDPTQLSKPVAFILSDDFKKATDGYKRASFILMNELKRLKGAAEAVSIVKDWNVRMGSPLTEAEIEFKANSALYSLSNDYVLKFLRSINMEM